MLPLPPPQPPKTKHAINTPPNASLVTLCLALTRPAMKARNSSASGRLKIKLRGIRLFGDPKGTAALVWTVAVAVDACVPSSVTEGGVTEHVAFAGSPAQERLTVCVDPASGLTVTGICTELPAMTVSDVGADIEKSTVPVPVIGTICGLLGSLSENERVASAAPKVVGAKFSVTLQVEFGPTVAPQSVVQTNSEAPEPVSDGGAEKVTAVAELFANVTI